MHQGGPKARLYTQKAPGRGIISWSNPHCTGVQSNEQLRFLLKVFAPILNLKIVAIAVERFFFFKELHHFSINMCSKFSFRNALGPRFGHEALLVGGTNRYPRTR